MPRILTPVLSRTDLPSAELQAARLDGEVFAVEECFALVDEVDHRLLRALALRAVLPQRLIAEQRTAAWVLGALGGAPSPYELCVEASARYRPTGLAVREVLLGPDDVVVIGGLPITSPFRTALDLARFADDYTQADADTVRRLSELGGFTIADLIVHLDGHRHLPGKLRAVHRLSVLIADSPGSADKSAQEEVTRYTS